ncbi:MAG: S8 family serine peptidase [Pelobium sp.]
MQKKICLALLSLLLLANMAFSQKAGDLVKEIEYVKLQQLSKEFQTKSDLNRKKAFELASKNNWVTFKVEKDGTIISLQGVDDLGYPLYLKTFNNTIAASTTKTTSFYAGGSLGLSLNGSTSALIGKVGIWDGGGVLTEHQEFSGGRIIQKDNPSSGSEHSTHVAGTMVASGVYPVARGMAWGLQKLYAYDFNADNAEMTTAASAGMLISNHSYGYIAGWNYNSDTTPERWEWYGTANATEDYKFGFYDNTARDWDIICYYAPYFLPVKSAGNSRSENGPAVGTEYFGFTATSGATLVSKGPRPAGINSNNSYDIISTTGTAKNILTVGAVAGLPYGPSNPSDIVISDFSSYGPTDDGRIKPDIVADGVEVTSTSNTDTKSYATLSGTSMSSPNVSGSLVLLQEYYAQLNAGKFMKSATLKGLVIETAEDAGNIGPDYIYGWGLLNMEKAANLIKLNSSKSLIAERALAQGETYTLNVTTSGYGPLKVTICWTDPEGTIFTSGTLNNRTPKLVNDLDLRLTKGVSTFLPFKLNPDVPAALATNADNVLDNLEQIFIPNAAPGETYTIKVSHKGTLSKGPQSYSLIVSGIGGTAYCASVSSIATDSRIESFTLASINNTLGNACRTYSDFTSIATDLAAGQTYPFSIGLGTCGVNQNKISKIFIDWNADGDFNDTNELIATSGVINNTANFTGNIIVPNDVIIGNSTLLRIVLTETNDPNMVISCGSYSNGETQDYKVNFVKSGVDAGVIAVNDLGKPFCPNQFQTFSVRLKNFGRNTLNMIPVSLSLIANGTVIKTINETFAGSLKPNEEADFQFTGTFNTQAGVSYTLSAKTEITADPIATNNSKSAQFKVLIPLGATSLSATKCDNDESFYQLNGEADGTIFWYKTANSLLPIAFGNKPSYSGTPQVNNTFYAGVNDFKSFFGPLNKQTYTTGTYSGNFGPKPEFSVAAPLVLDSATLYTSQPGQLTFTVETTSGAILSSVTINVERSKTSADVLDTNGQVINDPNDKGKAYKLGLEFPAAGVYRIGITYNGATIFRNNSGVTNIPITIANELITLRGAYFPSSNPTNITTSYYYFYNMLFKSLGCSDGERKPVIVSKPVITQNGPTLISSFNESNQWFFNGNIIEGATDKSYAAKDLGIYKVEVKGASGCISKSEDFNFGYGAEIELKMYPVPTSGNLNLSFKVQEEKNVKIRLINMLGQESFKINKENFTGTYAELLDLKHLNDGIYTVQIMIGGKVFVQKIIINK